MALTVAHAIEVVQHALGGKPAPELTEIELLNEAGIYLCNSHPWKWLEFRKGAIDFVAAQDYATLPSDFRELIPTLIRTLEVISYPELALRREAGGGWQFSGAVHYLSPNGSAGISQPVLGLHPTPSTSETGAVTIYYRAKWFTLTADSQFVGIPEFMEGCFKECSRQFALGWEDDQALAQRLVLFEASPILMAAKRTDANTGGGDLGPMVGGAVEWRESVYSALNLNDGASLGPV